MTHTEHDPVERALARESEWTGGPTDAWRSALDRHDEGRRSGAFRIRAWGGLAAAAALALAVTAAIYWPSYSRAPQQVASAPTPPAALKSEAGGNRAYYDGFETYAGEAKRQNVDDQRARKSAMSTDSAVMAQAVSPAANGMAEREQRDEAAVRLISQRATLELRAKDVASAFTKARHAISPARGEFVEASSLAGEGGEAQASLTLRVAPDRLDAVLTELRSLGAVEGERVSGEDVTAQAVDLDARLTAERRVEQELLELVTTRKDAPLDEVLQLRTALAGVRRSIEQLQAQRDSLSRLVSLSSVLILIRAEAAVPATQGPRSFRERFRDSVGDGWKDALGFVADASGVAVRIGVGGAVFWAPLALVAGVARRRWARERLR